MEPCELKNGDVVQLSPETTNSAFGHCMMVVTEPKEWGAQGYVQSAGIAPKQCYYRAKFKHMEYIGKAVWIAQ